MGSDDRVVAAGSDCGRVFLYDAASGAVLRALNADEDVANCVQVRQGEVPYRGSAARRLKHRIRALGHRRVVKAGAAMGPEIRRHSDSWGMQPGMHDGALLAMGFTARRTGAAAPPPPARHRTWLQGVRVKREEPCEASAKHRNGCTCARRASWFANRNAYKNVQ